MSSGKRLSNQGRLRIRTSSGHMSVPGGKGFARFIVIFQAMADARTRKPTDDGGMIRVAVRIEKLLRTAA